jgi:hypothetical protein
MIVTHSDELRTRHYKFHDLFRLALHSDSSKVWNHFQAEYGDLEEPPTYQPDLEVTASEFSVESNGDASRFGKYHVVGDWVYANDQYKVARWKFAMKGLASTPTRLFFDGGIFSLDFLQHYLIEQIMRYKISEKGTTLVHGGCIAKNGASVLFPGLGHTGKTALSLRKVLDGWEFQADDWTFVSKSGETRSYARRLHISHHMYNACPEAMEHLSREHVLSIKAKKLIYYLSLKYGDLSESLRIRELVPEAKIAERARLAAVVLLTGSMGTEIGEPRPIETEELVDRIMAINSREGAHFSNVMLAHYPKGNAISFPEMWEREREILQGALSEADCLEVTVPRHAPNPQAVLEKTARMIDEVL